MLHSVLYKWHINCFSIEIKYTFKKIYVCVCLRTPVYIYTCACSCVRDALSLFVSSTFHRLALGTQALTHSLTHLARCRSGSPQSWPRPWRAGLSRDSSHAGTFRSALSEPAPWPRFLLLTVRWRSYETAERAAQINPTATRLHFHGAAAAAAAAPPPAASEKAFQNKSGLMDRYFWGQRSNVLLLNIHVLIDFYFFHNHHFRQTVSH